MLSSFLAVTVVSVAIVVGYYATHPVPEGLSYPKIMREYSAFFDVMYYISPSLLEFVHEVIRRPSLTKTHPDVKFTEETLDGIPVIIYRPTKAESQPLPLVIHIIHGGGFMFGSIYVSHPAVLSMAVTLKNSLVISIGYRLAPKHIFPAAIDDVTKAVVWILRHTEGLEVDPSRIILHGESAGGNLVAALTQRLTFNSEYENLPKIRAQVLLYPCLQMVDFKLPSYQQNGQFPTLIPNPIWTAVFLNSYITGDSSLIHKIVNNEHISLHAKQSSDWPKLVSHDLIPSDLKGRGYVRPDPIIGDENIYDNIKHILLDPDFAPLMRPSLEGLPEAYIVAMEFDLLRDDSILYAKRLEADGVKTHLKCYKNGYHAQISLAVALSIPDNGIYDDEPTDDMFSYLLETKG